MKRLSSIIGFLLLALTASAGVPYIVTTGGLGTNTFLTNSSFIGGTNITALVGGRFYGNGGGLTNVSGVGGGTGIATNNGTGTNNYFVTATLTNATINGQSTAIDYNDGTLFFDATQILDGSVGSIDPIGRALKDSAAVNTLNWNTHSMSGGTWTVSSNLTLNTGGILTVPTIYTTGSGTSNWFGANLTVATNITSTSGQFNGNGAGITNIPGSGLQNPLSVTTLNAGTVNLTNVPALVVSNDTTVLGLGLTNIFEIRSTNTAALAPSLGVGTNKTVYFSAYPQVAGTVMGNLSTSNSLKVADITGIGNVANSNAPLTGTGIAGVVQTNNFTFATAEGGRLGALTISNDNRALPDTTNYFVLQSTNSAALAKDFAVGTNKNVYIGSGLTVGTAGNLLQGIQRGVATLQTGTNRVAATYASVTNPILLTPVCRDATNFLCLVSNIVEGTGFDIVAVTNGGKSVGIVVTSNTVSWLIVK